MLKTAATQSFHLSVHMGIQDTIVLRFALMNPQESIPLLYLNVAVDMQLQKMEKKIETQCVLALAIIKWPKMIFPFLITGNIHHRHA